MEGQYATMAAMALRIKLCTLPAGEKHHHDGYDFGIRHTAGPVPFPVVLLYGVFFDSIREKIAEVVCHIVNFCNFVIG